MLRLPRRAKPHAVARRNYRAPITSLTPLTATSTKLVLSKPVKLGWRHFEALRLKLARALSAQRRYSKKSQYKHQVKKRARRSRGPLKNPPLARVWYNGFPHHAYWTKSRGSRMGKGKGSLNIWYFKGQPGHVLAGFRHPNSLLERCAAHKACQLLPIRPLFTNKKFLHWAHNEILGNISLWL